MGSRDVTARLRQAVWNGSIPLEIRLHKGDCRTYDDSDPYLVSFHRCSLAFIDAEEVEFCRCNFQGFHTWGC